MTRASGVTPRRASWNVTRATLLACAPVHSAVLKLSKFVRTGAGRGDHQQQRNEEAEHLQLPDSDAAKLTPTTPGRRRGARSGRQAPIRAGPRGRWRVTSATCARGRGASTTSVRAGRARTAEMIDQIAKRARADVLAADQPQPIEPLLVRELDGLPPGHRAPSPSRHQHRGFNRRWGGLPLPDLALTALHQPRDVGAVHEPRQQRQREE
jgi:hypothetical protein